MYSIIRFYKSGKRKTILKNVTLDIARLHCNSSLTCKKGIYFDGYVKI